MHDPWIERLSDFIDGELDAADQAALEEHLAACDTCAGTIAELRAVVAAAAAAPREVRPDTDLWAGIAARIGNADTPVVRIDSRPARGRRYAFSATQLAAAAVILVALSGAAAWHLAGRSGEVAEMTGTLVHAAGAPSQSGRLVGMTAVPSDPELDRAIAELERTLDEQRDALDPATVDVLERSLAAIDDALREARTALDADPGNERLHRQLDTTLRRKLDVLRRAERITRAGA